jgi:hypothetical protein
MPQQVQIIYTVGPSDHPATIPGTFTALVAAPHMLTCQCRQPYLLRRRHHRHQASPRRQIRVVTPERRGDFREMVQQSPLRGVLPVWI